MQHEYTYSFFNILLNLKLSTCNKHKELPQGLVYFQCHLFTNKENLNKWSISHHKYLYIFRFRLDYKFNNNQVVTCTLYMVEELISLSFAFWSWSNIGTDRSATQSGPTLQHMHSHYLPNSNLCICGASHREAVSTILKVFGMTWSWVDQNPRPPKL